MPGLPAGIGGSGQTAARRRAWTLVVPGLLAARLAVVPLTSHSWQPDTSHRLRVPHVCRLFRRVCLISILDHYRSVTDLQPLCPLSVFRCSSFTNHLLHWRTCQRCPVKTRHVVEEVLDADRRSHVVHLERWLYAVWCWYLSVNRPPVCETHGKYKSKGWFVLFKLNQSLVLKYNQNEMRRWDQFKTRRQKWACSNSHSCCFKVWTTQTFFVSDIIVMVS